MRKQGVIMMQEVGTLCLMLLTSTNVHSDYIKATFPLVNFFSSNAYFEAMLIVIV